MQVEVTPISQLNPLENNPRHHSATQIEKLKESIERFGFTNPILAHKDSTIIAGHGRVEAAKEAGHDTVPVIFLDMDKADAMLYALADNRLSDLSRWDDDKLEEIAKELSELDMDLADAGFRVDEIDKLIGDGVEEDAPLQADDVQSLCEPGDVWHLGQHRVICGDSCDPSVVAQVLGNDKPNLMVTDPPYGVEYDPEWRNEHANAKPSRRMGKVQNDNRCDWTPTYNLFDGNVAYVWHGGNQSGHVQLSLENAGLTIRTQIVWVKSYSRISRGHYHSHHEPCYYAVREGESANWQGSRTESTVWEAELDVNDKTIHSTQKPIAVMSPPIKNHTVKGDAVCDPFLGSGTTLIAAEQLERICYGVELNPEYVDIIIARFQRHSDAEIYCERDGKRREIDTVTPTCV